MGKSWEHTKLKKICFERDNFTCVKCKHKGKKGYYDIYGGITIDLIADHIIPESLGGENKLENIQTLCLDCNKKKNAIDQSDIAKKKREDKNDRGE